MRHHPSDLVCRFGEPVAPVISDDGAPPKAEGREVRSHQCRHFAVAEGRLELLLGYPEGSHFARESTTRLLLPEFLERTSLRMTRWSSPSTTFRESFVHHVRGPYSSGHREAAYEWERLETCGCRSVLLVVVARCNGKCVTAHPAAPSERAAKDGVHLRRICLGQVREIDLMVQAVRSQI